MPSLLFATEHPFYPEAAGGSQRSGVEILRRLQARGWTVGVVCAAASRRAMIGRAWRRGSRDLPGAALQARRDDDLGFPVWRTFRFDGLPGGRRLQTRFVSPWFDRLLGDFAPDVVLGDRSAGCPLLGRAMQRGIPGVYLARSLPRFGQPTILPPNLRLIGNSPYTCRILEAITGRPAAVVRPMVPRRSYQVAAHSPEVVTLVNPIPHKGLDVALEVARRMPDTRFLWVKGRWASLSAEQIDRYARMGAGLPNVEVLDFCDDMREVYRRTRVLLMPSQFLETFGRVILEAHINGIPVVASDVGGVPETVGEGGIVVTPKENADGYVAALRELEDREVWERFSAAASANSLEPEHDPDRQFETLLGELEATIALRTGGC